MVGSALVGSALGGLALVASALIALVLIEGLLIIYANKLGLTLNFKSITGLFSPNKNFRQPATLPQATLCYFGGQTNFHKSNIIERKMQETQQF